AHLGDQARGARDREGALDQTEADQPRNRRDERIDRREESRDQQRAHDQLVGAEPITKRAGARADEEGGEADGRDSAPTCTPQRLRLASAVSPPMAGPMMMPTMLVDCMTPNALPSPFGGATSAMRPLAAGQNAPAAAPWTKRTAMKAASGRCGR